ncbi:MAG: glycerophosphodiester phosphodiesterase family protein [Propionibacteriaceae bacterium]
MQDRTTRAVGARTLVAGLSALAVALSLVIVPQTLASGAPDRDGRDDARHENARHKKDRPLVFAHRGSSKYTPEETISSFRRAIRDGADTLEADIAQTKDGELVIIHDDTLSRTTDVEELFPDRAPWNVRDFTLAEIKTLDAGTWFDPAFAGEKIVTLREWFEFTDRRVGLYPEIKNPDLYPGIIENVADELTDLGYTSEGRARNGAPQIWIQSREPRHVQAVHELLPDVPVAAFGHDGEPYSYVTASDEVLNEYASWGSGTLCHPQQSLPALVKRVQDAGVHCISEVSDGPEYIEMAVDQRYDVILTNTPDVARAVINGKDPLPRQRGLEIDSVVYNPEGGDVAPEGGEYVILRNTTRRAIDISEYTLREYGGVVLETGPDAVIEAGSFYRIHVGPGTDRVDAHFNGRTKQVLSDKLTDHVYLYNKNKVVEDIYAYYAS